MKYLRTRKYPMLNSNMSTKYSSPGESLWRCILQGVPQFLRGKDDWVYRKNLQPTPPTRGINTLGAIKNLKQRIITHTKSIYLCLTDCTNNSLFTFKISTITTWSAKKWHLFLRSRNQDTPVKHQTLEKLLRRFLSVIHKQRSKIQKCKQVRRCIP